ncbi:hypothetical protein BSQ88_01915 [Fusobacterium necrophorum subsp. funduliforme]|nr:hypothetical protein BSQ88_01915 [Fusobacterium necrophorum subsp. funduliforme]
MKRFWKKACYSESFMLEFLDSEKRKIKRGVIMSNEKKANIGGSSTSYCIFNRNYCCGDFKIWS